MGGSKQADYLSHQIILRSLRGLWVWPPLSDRRDSTPIFFLRSLLNNVTGGRAGEGGIIQTSNTFLLENVNTEVLSLSGRSYGGIFLGPPVRPQKVQ